MMRPRRYAGAVAIFAVGGLLAAGVYLLPGKSETPEEESAGSALLGAVGSAALGTISIPVRGEEAILGTMVLSVNASGQAEARRRTIVTPQVAGRISSISARENGQVGADQPLIILDPIDFEMALQEAMVTLRNAEASYRELMLFEDLITDAETRAEREPVLRRRSGLEQAELGLRRAELDLDRARVKAPIAGKVADVKVVPGQWVSAGTELLTIVDLDPIKVEVQVLAGEVGYLAQGRSAQVSFADFPGEKFTGRIESINPVVESGTRTARVTVLVPNPDGRILPGMYATAALTAREFADRVMVPKTALLTRDRRDVLFVYETEGGVGRAKWREVTRGMANETHVEILTDVETDSVRAGEIVLTDGHQTLVNDAQVQLIAAPGDGG